MHHLHCVVPGGGVSADSRRWIQCRPGFFLPVRVLSRMFRGKLLASLRQAFDAVKLKFHGRLARLDVRRAFGELLRNARKADWVVYCKPPFGGPAQALDCLGRYTHRVAISTHRLVRLENGKVTLTGPK